jgi:GPH family glycoside/pentoside/hexuronide:cation symporter
MADVVLEDSVIEGTGDSGARSGTFFAMLTLTAKLGAALAVGLGFWALSTLGFDAGAENTAETLTKFRWLMGALPVLTGLGVILILWRFPIDAERQRELRSQLENLKPTPGGEPVLVTKTVVV